MRIANLAGRLVLVVDDGRAIDVADASAGEFGPDPQAAYSRWSELRSWAGHADPARARPFDPHDLGSPVPAPKQVFAIGLNYREHAAESGFAVATQPLVFTKFPSCITGPYGDIVLPPGGN